MRDFRRILTQKGIPVHITSKTGYFQTLEIQGIVNLLRVLDNPLQDIPLYGVLKLPCFDITEAEVAMLRCAAKENKEKMKKRQISSSYMKRYANTARASCTGWHCI